MAALSVLFCCAAATAEVQEYRATINGIRYSVNAAIYYADEVPYVSLNAIVDELSGRAEITSDTQGEARLAGGRATMAFNSPEVTAGLKSFALEKPVLRYEDQILIPRDETARFFEEAFGVNLLPLRAADLDDPALDEEIAAENQGPGSAPVLRGIDTVVIDPGHGGADAGTVGPSGTSEKDLALRVALALREEIKRATTLKVYVTREDDQDLTFAERMNLVNQYPNALIVSLHTGASFADSAHGIEFFTAAAGPGAQSDAETQSRMAAEAIAEAVIGRTDATLRGVRGVPLRLLGDASMPGVHVEMGCLNNPAQEELLNTDGFQRQLVQGLTEGVQRVALGASAS